MWQRVGLAPPRKFYANYGMSFSGLIYLTNHDVYLAKVLRAP